MPCRDCWTEPHPIHEGNVVIHYCPLHAAAPALLEALELTHLHAPEPYRSQARAAIRLAKGGDNA